MNMNSSISTTTVSGNHTDKQLPSVFNDSNGGSELPITLKAGVCRVLGEFLPQPAVAVSLRLWRERYQNQDLSSLISLSKDIARLFEFDAHQLHLLRMNLYQEFRSFQSFQNGR